MGLRETMNQNPKVVTGITAGIIVIVLAMILWPTGGTAPSASTRAQLYFTTDDGETWFADDAKKVPPFDHKGKPAYRACVYKCGGKTFVNHMERYTEEAAKKMQAIYSRDKPLDDSTAVEIIQHAGMEVKARGGSNWTKMSDASATTILQPKCPDGAGDLEELLP